MRSPEQKQQTALNITTVHMPTAQQAQIPDPTLHTPPVPPASAAHTRPTLRMRTSTAPRMHPTLRSPRGCRPALTDAEGYGRKHPGWDPTTKPQGPWPR